MKSHVRIIFSSIALLVCMFLFSLLTQHFIAIGASDQMWALIAALYLIVFPCITGALLKVTVNNKKPAMIIISLCIVIWSAGEAVIWGENLILQLLLKALFFPITMLFYYITFLTLKREKKRASIAIAGALTLLAAFVLWCGVLLFLSLLGWEMPPDI